MTDGATTERFTPKELELMRAQARMRGRYSGIVTFLQGLQSRTSDRAAAELIQEFLERDKREALP